MNINKEQINKANQDAHELLQDKGLKLNEILKIKKAFIDWSKEHDDTIEGDKDYWRSKTNPGYVFNSKEEVQFFNALCKLSPDTDKKKVIEVLKITFTLLNINSDWKF